MTSDLDDFLDDQFLGCAFAAWVDEAILEQGRPDEEKTRERAYRYYEQSLAEKNRTRDRREPRFESPRRRSAAA